MEDSEDRSGKNIHNIEHLVVLSNSVKFCETQYIVHIVLQILNQTIWELSDDCEVELFKEFIIRRLLEEEFWSRRFEIKDLERILTFFYGWIYQTPATTIPANRYCIYNRFESQRNNDKKFRKSPFKSLISLKFVRDPQIVIGKDFEGRTRVIFLGLKDIDGDGSIESVKNYTVKFSEFFNIDDFQIATEERLRELFQSLTIVLVIQERANLDNTVGGKSVGQLAREYKARGGYDSFVTLTFNLSFDSRAFWHMVKLCSLKPADLDKERKSFLCIGNWEYEGDEITNWGIWERAGHIIAREKQRLSFPLESRLGKAISQHQRYNFLCFDFTKHLELNLPLVWEPYRIELGLFLDTTYRDIFFFNRHPELVESGPFLEEVINKELFKSRVPEIIETISRVSVGDLLAAFRGELDEYSDNPINVLFPTVHYIALLEIISKKEQALENTLIGSAPTPFRLLTINEIKLRKRLDTLDDPDFRFTSSLTERLLKGHLAILEQIHLRRCICCRTLGIDKKRSTGALSIFCIGGSKSDKYPLTTLRYEAKQHFLISTYCDWGYYQRKVWKSFKAKQQKGDKETSSIEAIQEVISSEDEQQPESVTEPVSGAVENTTGDSADDGLRRSKRNKH